MKTHELSDDEIKLRELHKLLKKQLEQQEKIRYNKTMISIDEKNINSFIAEISTDIVELEQKGIKHIPETESVDNGKPELQDPPQEHR